MDSKWIVIASERLKTEKSRCKPEKEREKADANQRKREKSRCKAEKESREINVAKAVKMNYNKTIDQTDER